MGPIVARAPHLSRLSARRPEPNVAIEGAAPVGGPGPLRRMARNVLSMHDLPPDGAATAGREGIGRTPVATRLRAQPAPADVLRAEVLAERLRERQPALTPDHHIAELMVDHLTGEPCLHFDDLRGLPLLDRRGDPSFLEDRARLRAADGDLLASCSAPCPTFEHYCEHRLGLGSVRWLRPTAPRDPLSVAAACFADRDVRRELVQAIRHGGLRYVHPGYGAFDVWATTWLLRRTTRQPLAVIAPPPHLATRINDKLWFGELVAALFGDEALPRTFGVDNYAALARVVQHLAVRERRLVLKVPDGCGGIGNLVVETETVRDLPLGRVRRALKDQLRGWCWEPGDRLLVGTWESNVLEAPSTQTWIPPERDGLPIVEGLFLQAVEGPSGTFVGNRPAALPDALSSLLVERSWLLARTLQRLGYVGRCSFDLLLVGDDLSTCRAEFIECNGRWGGTSTPMTLCNRLLGDWTRRPYAMRTCKAPGLSRRTFADLLAHFDADLFDARTGSGDLVFYSPGRMRARDGIDVIAFGDTWQQANDRAAVEVPARLAECTRSLTETFRP